MTPKPPNGGLKNAILKLFITNDSYIFPSPQGEGSGVRSSPTHHLHQSTGICHIGKTHLLQHTLSVSRTCS